MKAGFQTSPEKVYPVSYFAPAYLKMRYPDLCKVYIIGREGFIKEARDAGLEVVSGIDHDHLTLKDEHDFDKMYVDDEIKAVLIGEDSLFNFYKLSFASVCIQ
jgi:ribonucleotide monophosphatase NagD (HAD superfamily)